MIIVLETATAASRPPGPGGLLMPRLAVSGHRNLPAGSMRLVGEAIRLALSDGAGNVTGLSCLADGADQIFARAVLDLGGDIEAVIPAEKHRDGLPRAGTRGV